MRKIIQGQKVVLRPLQESDLPLRAQWTADRELCALMGGSLNETREPSAEQEIRSNREWLARRHSHGVMPYAVEVDGHYIGDIDFERSPTQRKAGLTVFLGDRSAWGKGYGTEAVERVIEELFTEAQIDVIEVDVAPHNTRALAFWQKLGFSEYTVDERGTRFLHRFRGAVAEESPA